MPTSSGGITQTDINFTGQRLDGTGLLYYHARMYDPVLGRFVSADSVVPGSASGAGGAAATLGVDGSSQLAPLTVDVHEPGFVAAVNGENAFRAAKGFWFQLSDDDKQQAKSPWGPANPQALNRYSYVGNNPLNHTDPTGHCIFAGIDTLVCVAVAVGVVEVVVTVIVAAVVIDGAINLVKDATTPDSVPEAEGTTAEKAENPPWSGLKPFRGKTKTNGESGKNRRYYEKDYTHGDVEVYDSRGNHLGSMDPETGKMTKPPVPGRRINI